MNNEDKYVSPSHKNRRPVQIYKKVDDVAKELKFDLRLDTKQEVYQKAIECLYEKTHGKSISLKYKG